MLYIAEKPSLARAIAEGLGNGQKRDGYIVCGTDTVTWCFGHMLELYAPNDYDPALKYWQRSTLPMIPKEWKIKPYSKSAAQLDVIKTLLQQATSVVNAGDPDREGQLLVDEVLEYFNYRGTVQRIWLASLDARSVAKALANLADNKKYAPLRDAARARSQADWLVGLNATRAMTILGHESGRQGTLSQGRVQTPTLALVVNRDREIEAFRPIDYFTLQASLEQNSAGTFAATFVPDDTQAGLDVEGRLVDAAVVQNLADAVRGQAGTITEVVREKKKKAVPLPHCLSSLQKAASSKFGMTAQAVLDTAQALYEKKVTTYPRSDCRNLPDEQFSDAARIIVTLGQIPELAQVAGKADSSLRGPVWDTAKITAHHAIIPTGEIPGQLSEAEHNLYIMIATAYCLQFYPPMQYEAQKIVVDLQQTRWEARGRLMLEAGWTGFATEDEDDAKEKDQSLPAVTKGDAVTCTDVTTLKKKTSPPSRFSEGTLIEAMANIHRFVTDAKAKATLKENEGIGTEATRAKILETLKKNQFLVADGKALVSTPLGRTVIDLTPAPLKDPVTTAKWESRLEAVTQGKETLAAFMTAEVEGLPALLAPILNATPKLVPGTHPCPTCGKALARRDGKNGGFYWSCSAYPDCKQPTLPDDNGKPGAPREKKPQNLTAFKCQKCGSPLRLREDIGKNGKPYQLFLCTGYPNCKESWFGKDGKPDFEGRKK